MTDRQKGRWIDIDISHTYLEYHLFFFILGFVLLSLTFFIYWLNMYPDYVSTYLKNKWKEKEECVYRCRDFITNLVFSMRENQNLRHLMIHPLLSQLEE